MNNLFETRSIIRGEASGCLPNDLGSKLNWESEPIQEPEPLRQCQNKNHNNPLRKDGMCQKVESFRSLQQGSKQQAQMDRIRGGLCEFEEKYDMDLNVFPNNHPSRSEQVPLVKHINNSEVSQHPVIDRKVEIGTARPLQPREESSKIPKNDENKVKLILGNFIEFYQR